MRAELPALRLVERLFQQGAEDRRIDLDPGILRGGQQLADLLAAQREGAGLLEQAAVEVAQMLS